MKCIASLPRIQGPADVTMASLKLYIEIGKNESYETLFAPDFAFLAKQLALQEAYSFYKCFFADLKIPESRLKSLQLESSRPKTKAEKGAHAPWAGDERRPGCHRIEASIKPTGSSGPRRGPVRGAVKRMPPPVPDCWKQQPQKASVNPQAGTACTSSRLRHRLRTPADPDACPRPARCAD